jgi:hypothetical protein
MPGDAADISETHEIHTPPAEPEHNLSKIETLISFQGRLVGDERESYA